MAENPGVQVTYGTHVMMADAIGKTVGQVKAAMAQVMNIPTNAGAVIGSKRVTDDTIIEKGQQVEFIKEAGVKG